MSDTNAAVWFVTGSSTGFGRELAMLAMARGNPLVATARSVADIQDLAKGREDKVLALPLDVTDQAQIKAAVATALDRFGSIDVLVNNAGYGYRSSVEDGDEAEIRRMFETNVFGLFAVTRAVVPAMRERRRGHIINLSSIAGLSGTLGGGYYAATKHAVEGISDALRQEMQPFGVKVTCVEPGPFRTDFAGRSIRQTEAPHPDYEHVRERFRVMGATNGRQAGDPRRAAELMFDIALSDDPPRHLVLGTFAIDAARDKLERLRRDLDAWETAGRGTDFPAEA